MNPKLMIGCEFVDYMRSFGPNEVFIIPVGNLKGNMTS